MPRARDADRRSRHDVLLTHERELWKTAAHVAGLDEAGAGPWAGPVTAACVVLDPERLDPLLGADDSKRLSEAERARLAPLIREHARAFAVASAGVEEIDRLNIRRAALLAMSRALDAVVTQLGAVHHLLIDARVIEGVTIPQTALVGGDGLSLSIAAASILAKVDRDAFMTEAAARFPGYGFETHKGYGTPEHQAALAALGPSPLHRQSFAPIRVDPQLSLF